VTFRTKKESLLFEKTEYAKLLSEIIFNSGKLKRFDILAYQIMPGHIHLLVNASAPTGTTERTLKNVRSVLINKNLHNPKSTLSMVRYEKNFKYTISDLSQSIKGNFSRKIHMGNLWQRRFYTKIINTHKYLETIIQYIQNNPIMAKLPDKYHKPPYQFFDWSDLRKLF